MMLFGTEPIEKVNRVISVSEGLIEGRPGNNPAFTVFCGVPYAKAPVGEYRWTLAQPPESWEGIRKCHQFQSASIQEEQMKGAFYQKEFYPDVTPISEDCLYLNIWTPNCGTTEKLPILFYIHGGAFLGGFSWEMEFDGEAMCRRDCILVTVGYRLGALGFFAHPQLSEAAENNVSGNYAITDCLQALKWVSANAASFGGDANKVTIFGQSAGGAMVQSLLTCPWAKGLFKRAIVQSAGGLNTLGAGLTLEMMEEMGSKVCKRMGKSLDELKQMDATVVSKAIMKEINDIMGQGLFMNPCIDGYYQPKASGAAIAAGEHLDVEIMTGSVGGDGGLFAGWPVGSIEAFEENMQSQYGPLAETYLDMYDMKDLQDLENIQKLRSNVYSLVSPRGWAKVELMHKRKPLYVYYFNRKMPGDEAGAYHSSELWYIFGTLDRCWRSMTPEFCVGDYALSRAMTAYWCNFAKTGNPNGANVPEWLPFTEAAPMTLFMDEKEIVNNALKDIPLLEEHVKLQIKQYCS